MGQHNEAIDMLNRVLEMKKKILGPDSIEISSTLNQLAIYHRKLGRIQESDGYARQAE